MSLGLMQISRRKTVRAPVNPLDRATVVSILPRPINETKPTLQPGTFHINAGTFEKPSLLVVEPSSYWIDINEDQPLLEVPVASIIVAQSIVKDYANGLLACDMNTRMPGLFFVPGEHTVSEIKEKYNSNLIKAKFLQNAWFSQLVLMGDALWARSMGNPLAIDDWMKLAANELGLEKEWTKTYTMTEMTRCVACGAVRNPNFPVCGTCGAVNDAEKVKGIQFIKK